MAGKQDHVVISAVRVWRTMLNVVLTNEDGCFFFHAHQTSLVHTSSAKFWSKWLSTFPSLQKTCRIILLLPQATYKRIRRGSPDDSSLNTCAVHISADHLFFKHVGADSESATVAEMVYHVGMADKAFRATDFNQDGGPGDGIGFVIAAVTVFKDETAEGKWLWKFSKAPLMVQPKR